MPINVDSIHEKLKNFLEIKRINQLDQQAQEIEQVLRALKYKQQASEPNDIFSELMIDQIREQATKSLKFRSTDRLFKRSHGSAFRAGADDIAEAEIAAIIAAIQNEGTGSNLTYQDFLAGRDPVTVYSKEIIQRLPERVGGKITNNLQTKVKEGENWKHRSQKTDVVGITTITGKIAPEYEKLIELFSNVTFSIKNYSSISEIDSLSLGSTNPQKALRGALYHIGYRRNFDAAVSAVEKNPKHKGHLIFAYELAGWGQGTGIGKNFAALPAVDFLIYNDPAVPESIAVRSTKKIIYDKIMDTKGLGSSNKILKSYFGMQESKYKR